MSRKLLTFCLSLFALVFVVSCSDDDVPNPFGEQNPNPLIHVKMKVNGTDWIAENITESKPDEYPVEEEYYRASLKTPHFEYSCFFCIFENYEKIQKTQGLRLFRPVHSAE